MTCFKEIVNFNDFYIEIINFNELVKSLEIFNFYELFAL